MGATCEGQNLATLVNAALADEAALSALELWLRAHKVGRDVALGDDVGSDLRDDQGPNLGEAPADEQIVSPPKDPPKDPVENPKRSQKARVPEKVG